MENFTPFSALAGGVLIGLASIVLMLFAGRIAGISGIVGGLMNRRLGDWAWRATFTIGLIGGAYLTTTAIEPDFTPHIAAGTPALVLGGLLVGFGTRLGNGCTSGHGICGLSRFSARSLVATLLFMISAAAVVFVTRHVAGA
jgi:uncharacterized membrane protein YedE/YeeE